MVCVTKQAEGLQFFLHFLGYFPYFYNILWDDHCPRGGKWWFLCCWHWAWQTPDILNKRGSMSLTRAWWWSPLWRHVGTTCQLVSHVGRCSLSYPVLRPLAIGLGLPCDIMGIFPLLYLCFPWEDSTLSLVTLPFFAVRPIRTLSLICASRERIVHSL